MLDYEKLIQARANRQSRAGKPFSTFFESIKQATDAADAIVSGGFAPEFKPLMERAVVICTVTAVEVYFRDMLDAVFRFCSPDFFRSKLKFLHPDKYEIDDLLAVYEHRIHPLELVSWSQSFQNTQRIDRVFSKLLGRSFWTEVLSMQVRVAEKPETETSFDHSGFEALQRVFNLRHELVHDPAKRCFLTSKIRDDIWDCAFMVLGADIVLMRLMQEHADPGSSSAMDA